jgi:hypothetical protein
MERMGRATRPAGRHRSVWNLKRAAPGAKARARRPRAHRKNRWKRASILPRADRANFENAVISAKKLDAAKGWATIKISARRLKL